MAGQKTRLFIPGVGESIISVGSGVPYGAADDVAQYPVGTLMRIGSKTFVYARTGGAITSLGMGCKNPLPQGVANSVLAANAAAGATQVSITTSATSGAAGTGLMLLDEFKGGEIVLFTSGSDIPQIRGLTGNTARVATGNVTVVFYLDSPLRTALTTANGTAECMHSPWRAVAQDATEGHPVVGIPMATATSGQFLWLQTWGPCFVSPQATLGVGAGVNACFRHDGSVDLVGADAYAADHCQPAGWVLSETSTHTQAAPFIMLTIVP